MTTSTWHDAPYAFFRLPSCPFCGSPERITVRSTRENDGSVTRRTICRQCSERYVLVLEPDELPRSGRGGRAGE